MIKVFYGKIITADDDIDFGIPSLRKMSDEEFLIFAWGIKKGSNGMKTTKYILCRLQETIHGENSVLNPELALWNKNHKNGIVFDSSAGFFLPR